MIFPGNSSRISPSGPLSGRIAIALLLFLAGFSLWIGYAVPAAEKTEMVPAFLQVLPHVPKDDLAPSDHDFSSRHILLRLSSFRLVRCASFARNPLRLQIQKQQQLISFLGLALIVRYTGTGARKRPSLPPARHFYARLKNTFPLRAGPSAFFSQEKKVS